MPSIGRGPKGALRRVKRDISVGDSEGAAESVRQRVCGSECAAVSVRQRVCGSECAAVSVRQ
jgi:hypothetical protein